MNMEKTILILALVAGMVLLAGCTADSSQAGGQPNAFGGADAYANGGAQVAPGDGQQYAGNGSGAGAPYAGTRSGMMRNGSGMTGRGGFGNITDAQRQQMMQAFEEACSGKAAGDACTVQVGALGGTQGAASGGASGQINGTCSARGGNLTCMPSGMGGRNGTRAGFGQPGGNPAQGGAGQPPQNP